MFGDPIFGAALAVAVRKSLDTPADHAADAFCYMAGHWRRADDVIDVEAREVPEPRLIGYDLAAPECEACGDTGLVGYPPDDYFACPGCST